MKKILLLFLLFVAAGTLLMAQNSPPGKITSGGEFDLVFDRFGKQHRLEDLMIKKPQPRKGNGNQIAENLVIPSYLLCGAGYFDLYFEEGSGCETNMPAHVARRNVLCQVFTDISAFITPVNPSVKVNIWIRNIGNIVTYPINSGVLGGATSFYVVPTVTPNVGGIIDGQVWKTINSGVDAYTNVASPLVTAGAMPGAGNFYHAMMGFNFVDSPTVIWHTDLTTTTASGKFDLYSVALHEATHALGFTSMIGPNGGSVLGSNFPYYTRYDLNLMDFSSAPLIVTLSPCSLYEHQFNPSIWDPSQTVAPNPLANPHVPDYTDCLLANIYGGSVNQIVYTPNHYEPGSSLCHFEDECYNPIPYGNNEYYNMSNAQGTGSLYMKRYLKPEERSVMCDIGYKVNTTYGNMLNVNNNYNYGGSACAGLDVAGVNDGLTGIGIYAWTTTPTNVININGSDLLNNDYNADSYECLEVINGMGSVTGTSGNASTPIAFTAGTNTGAVLLRYIPYNSTTGNRGDITYLHMYIYNGSCLANTCDMLMNSGFESGTNCGEVNSPDNAVIDCWEPLIESPDYFVRGCTPSINVDVTVPTGIAMSTPATDTWNSSWFTNDAFLGLGHYSGGVEEVEQTKLATPLMPDVNYTVTFWAKSANSTGSGGALSGKNKVVFRGETGLLAPLPSGSYMSTGYYLTEVTVPDDGEWHYYTLDFSYTDIPFMLENFMVGNMGQDGATGDSYVFIDDLTLLPTNNTAVFKAPQGLCGGATTIPDLSKYVFPANSAIGTFTGTGVSYSGGVYSFTAPSNGIYTIEYEFTGINGCKVKLYSQIKVSPSPQPTLTLSFSPSAPPVFCTGTEFTLTCDGAQTYAWYSVPDSTDTVHRDSIGAIIPCSGPCSSVLVTPPGNGYKYHVIGIDSNGCSDTTGIFIPVEPCPGGGGGGVRTFEMIEDVKHYTTKIVPGTNNYSVMAGTIFRSTGGGGANTIHFLLLNNNGDVIISKEYPSTSPDERVVDIQGFTDKFKVTRWYIVCQANGGIKILCVNNVGNLLDQREYLDMGGLTTYPMNAVVWTDGGNDRRLFICGYQTLGGGLDYTTPKQAFLMDININRVGHMNRLNSYGYNWGWTGPGSPLGYDYDMATRMAVVKSSNNLWITGSTNGIAPIAAGASIIPPPRSAAMNLVVDPYTGAVLADNSFIENNSSDNSDGPSDYGVDLIQVDNGNYILGNSAKVDLNPASMPTWHQMIPREFKLWWIQPVDDNFNPIGSRSLYWNNMEHWASQAIVTGGNSITVGTLIQGQYSACIPLPHTPAPNNIQVNMVMVDLSSNPPTTGTSKIYMTSTGTGAVPSVNSYHDLGGPQSLIDYPPKFADLGKNFYAISAPKFMNGQLNMKVLTPSAGLGVQCGEFTCTTTFIHVPITNTAPVSPSPSDIQMIAATTINLETPFTIVNPPTCHDIMANPSYSQANPNQSGNMFEGTRVYPNPATHAVVLELDREIPSGTYIDVRLHNILGQEVAKLYSGNAHKKMQLRLPDLPEGVYFIEIIHGDNSAFKQKLMIEAKQ